MDQRQTNLRPVLIEKSKHLAQERDPLRYLYPGKVAPELRLAGDFTNVELYT